MEHCEVGMFRLPGLSFEKGRIPPELAQEINAWCRENNCGYCDDNGVLWAFKTVALRDWFILRWSESIPKPAEKASQPHGLLACPGYHIDQILDK